MRRALAAVVVVASFLLTVQPACAFVADYFGENDNDFAYPVVRTSGGDGGAGATLMVQGRWYGWEHLRVFDSASSCENIRKMIRTRPDYIDTRYDGMATRVAGRATKCVLAGGS